MIKVTLIFLSIFLLLGHFSNGQADTIILKKDTLAKENFSLLIKTTDSNRTIWSENGKIYQEILKLDDGKEEWTQYYFNGQIELTGVKQGDNIGPWTWYYENGNIKRTGKFKHFKDPGKYNSADGKWKFYNENGTIKMKAIYKNGMQIKILYYDEKGKVTQINRHKGKFSGFPDERHKF